MTFAEQQQSLRERIGGAEQALGALSARLRDVDAELDDLARQAEQFQLLGTVCASLDRLRELGAAELFWSGPLGGIEPQDALAQARRAIDEFNGHVARRRETRAALLADIQSAEWQVGDLHDDLARAIDAEENEKFAFVIDREARRLPFRTAVMPWSAAEEDRRRMRKTLWISLLLMFFVGAVPQFWTLPPIDRNKPVAVPERLVQMVKKKEPPKPVERPQEVKRDKPEEAQPVKKEEQKPREAQPTPADIKQARTRAEAKGVLAFKDSFTDLIDEAAPSALGADARISTDARQALGGAPGHGAAGTRSLILAQATGGSGGIAGAGISRGGVGSGSGSAIAGSGVQVARAQSSIGTDMKEAGRPLSKGAGPARTDEEIQIVFDRYKSALYRIYNRELRNDPTLRGKMVLALTIEPDGRVSACRVQSTDMNSPALSADIVERVLKFNFGAKEGVPPTKILYPIDFLPAS